MSEIGSSGRETPFDLLVLADFLPEGPADAPLRSRPHRVDAASFGDLLKKAAPALSIDIGGGKAVGLRFDELRAFRPEALPRHVVSVPPAALPDSLVRRFAGESWTPLVALLRFVAPTTTGSDGAGLGEGRRRPAEDAR